MYNFKYNYVYESGDNPEEKYIHNTILTARFLFDQQVAPKDIREVKERLRLSSRSKEMLPGNRVIIEGPLDEFMRRTLYYQPSSIDIIRGKEYFGHREVVRITSSLFGLGLNLVSEAKGQLDRTDMINIESINEFVLTGKLSPRVKEQLQRQKTVSLSID